MYNPLVMLEIHYILILAGALLVVTVFFGYVTHSLANRIKQLTLGTNGKNLEDAIYQLMEDHTIFGHRIESVEQTNARLNNEIKGSVRGIATVRYNAFADVGGKQSFATALICENGSGVVVSSIYTRERVNIYAKPIVNFQSEYELSTEESRALKEASKVFN